MRAAPGRQNAVFSGDPKAGRMLFDIVHRQTPRRKPSRCRWSRQMSLRRRIGFAGLQTRRSPAVSRAMHNTPQASAVASRRRRPVRKSRRQCHRRANAASEQQSAEAAVPKNRRLRRLRGHLSARNSLCSTRRPSPQGRSRRAVQRCTRSRTRQRVREAGDPRHRRERSATSSTD